MVDGVDAAGRQHALDQVGIADRSQVGMDGQLGKTRRQLLPDGVQGVFGMVDQVQARRTQGDDLAAQLAADGTAGARHQHPLAAHAAREQVEPRRHRRSAQQVFELDLADRVAQDRLVAGLVVGQVDQPGEDLGGHAGLAQALHQFAQAFGRGGGQGDDDGADAERRGELDQARSVEHAQAGHGAFVQRMLVVEEAQRTVLVAVAHGLGQPGAGLAGAVDGDRQRIAGAGSALAAQQLAYADARDDNIRKSDEPIYCQRAARESRLVEEYQSEVGA